MCASIKGNSFKLNSAKSGVVATNSSTHAREERSHFIKQEIQLKFNRAFCTLKTRLVTIVPGILLQVELGGRLSYLFASTHIEPLPKDFSDAQLNFPALKADTGITIDLKPNSVLNIWGDRHFNYTLVELTTECADTCKSSGANFLNVGIAALKEKVAVFSGEQLLYFWLPQSPREEFLATIESVAGSQSILSFSNYHVDNELGEWEQLKYKYINKWDGAFIINEGGDVLAVTTLSNVEYLESPKSHRPRPWYNKTWALCSSTPSSENHYIGNITLLALAIDSYRNASTASIITQQDTRDKPLLHVLMPIYNGERFIHKSIPSVLQQNYPSLKLLILNGGSTDNTQAMIEAIQKEQSKKIHLIPNKNSERQGVAWARITLLNASKELNPNAYICTLESDDKYTDPNFITKVINQMLQTHADVCLVNFSIAFETPDQYVNATGLIKEKNNMAELLKHINNLSPAVTNVREYPRLLEFTSLGWTKVYAPHVKFPEHLNMPYEDFVSMAVLITSKHVTALEPDYEPIEYFRRSGSLCGQRTHENFSVHVPSQLERFFDAVCAGAESTLEIQAAKDFVLRKLNQYELE